MLDDFVDGLVRDHHLLMVAPTLVRSSSRQEFSKLYEDFVMSSNLLSDENFPVFL